MATRVVYCCGGVVYKMGYGVPSVMHGTVVGTTTYKWSLKRVQTSVHNHLNNNIKGPNV